MTGEHSDLQARRPVRRALISVYDKTGLAELATGLHAAGVPTVVGCLWEVGEVAARILMERFYANWLARPMEPRAALREAQLWMRDASAKELEEVGTPGPWNQPALQGAARVEADPPFAAPVHWAGWVYSGA